jgi:hypothetical protein
LQKKINQFSTMGKKIKTRFNIWGLYAKY